MNELKDYWNLNLRLDVDGGEIYIPFAKDKLRKLKKHMRESNKKVGQKKFIIGNASIYINSCLGYDTIRIRDIAVQDLYDRLILYCWFGCGENLPPCVSSPCYFQLYDIIYKKGSVRLSPSDNHKISAGMVYCYYFPYHEDIQSSRKQMFDGEGEKIPKHLLFGPYCGKPYCNPRYPSYEQNMANFVVHSSHQRQWGAFLYYFAVFGNFDGGASSSSLMTWEFKYLNDIIEECYQKAEQINTIHGHYGELVTLTEDIPGSPPWTYSYYSSGIRQKNDNVKNAARGINTYTMYGLPIRDQDTRIMNKPPIYIIFYNYTDFDSDANHFESVEFEQSFSIQKNPNRLVGDRKNTVKVLDYSVTKWDNYAMLVFNIEGSPVKINIATLNRTYIYDRSNISTTEIHNVSPGYAQWPDSWSSSKLEYIETITDTTTGEMVNDMSCQINDDFIVYTYDVWDRHLAYLHEKTDVTKPVTSIKTADSMTLLRRVVGYINISDDRLPVGYHKQFTYVPNENKSKPNVRCKVLEGNVLMQGPARMAIRIMPFNPCSSFAMSDEEYVRFMKDDLVGGIEIKWNEYEEATGYVVFVNDNQWKTIMGNENTSITYPGPYIDRDDFYKRHSAEMNTGNTPSIGVDFQ